MDNALSEYRSLCIACCELHQRHEEQKIRVRLLLEDLAALRRRIAGELGKTDRLTRRLTGLQRMQLGLLHAPGDRIRPLEKKETKNIPAVMSLVINPEVTLAPEFPEAFRTQRELKAGQIRILSIIDTLKKSLLSLELLELRCRELLDSINKAMEAYAFEWRRIRRSIYPLGIITVCIKCIREFFGRPHFSGRDLRDLAVLGNLTGSIMKMAESPVF